MIFRNNLVIGGLAFILNLAAVGCSTTQQTGERQELPVWVDREDEIREYKHGSSGYYPFKLFLSNPFGIGDITERNISEDVLNVGNRKLIVNRNSRIHKKRNNIVSQSPIVRVEGWLVNHHSKTTQTPSGESDYFSDVLPVHPDNYGVVEDFLRLNGYQGDINFWRQEIEIAEVNNEDSLQLD